MTEERPDSIRRASLPIQIKKSHLEKIRNSVKKDSKSSERESRDSRRKKSKDKKKDKKKKNKKKDKKVLTITIHDDNEIVSISDDEPDGSDKVSLKAKTFEIKSILRNMECTFQA